MGQKQGRLLTLETSETIRLILSKFHVSIQDAWNKQVIDRGDSSFSKLVEFLERRNKLLSNPYFSRDAYSDKDSKKAPSHHLGAFATGLEDSDDKEKPASAPREFVPKCRYCSEAHWAENCDKLERMPPVRGLRLSSPSICVSDVFDQRVKPTIPAFARVD